MIAPEEARGILMARSHAFRRLVRRPLSEAAGYLGDDIIAPHPLPRGEESAMDGYAIAGDGRRRFNVIGEVPAGSIHPRPVEEGEAVTVFTGALLPEGTDTVVPVENARREGAELEVEEYRRGQHVRRRGEDIDAGDIVVRAGTAVTPGLIMTLAALGIPRLSVYAPPRVGIVVTGDEVVAPGQETGTGRKHDANGPFLIRFLRSFGIIPLFITHAADAKNRLTGILNARSETLDLLLVTGGVSVGKYDYTRTAVEETGGKQLFWKVAQKPGKPLYAAQLERMLVVGLPGNPGAVFTSSWIHLAPILRNILGAPPPHLPHKRLEVTADIAPASHRHLFLRGRIEGSAFKILPGQGSHMVGSLPEADGIAEIPPGTPPLRRGSPVTVYPLTPALSTP